MKTVAVYIQNKLLSSGIIHVVTTEKPEITIKEIPTVESCLSICRSMGADILLAELRDYAPLSLEQWLDRAEGIKKILPYCKIVLMVDEENYPKSALIANAAFKNEEIDMFLYSSSGLKYLVDIIANL